MRRVLIVSPRFPPTNAPDMHRVRQSLPYLREFGWEATVLAVEPAQCNAPLDPLLLGTVPEDVRIIRVPAIGLGATRPFGLGSLGLRALPFLARAGDRLLGAEDFDLVYFSTTEFPVLGLGPRWLRRFDIPFVVDLQDPWWSADDYYSRPGAPRPPGGRIKYALSRSLARRMESRMMGRVAHVISVSPAYPSELTRRYHHFRPDDFTVLPFGASVADLEVLSRATVRQSIFDADDGFRHWVYVGAAGGIMRRSLTGFFAALGAARSASPAEFERLRIHFVGTDYAPGDRARPSVEPIARSFGVADLIEEQPQRIPYFEALQCLREAEALVVPGSDDSGYTASKLYPYILARKPMLAIFHEQSSVVEVLRRTQAGTVVTFSDDGIDNLAARIGAAWFDRRGWEIPPSTDWTAFERFTAREMTRRQCEVFDRVVISGLRKR